MGPVAVLGQAEARILGEIQRATYRRARSCAEVSPAGRAAGCGLRAAGCGLQLQLRVVSVVDTDPKACTMMHTVVCSRARAQRAAPPDSDVFQAAASGDPAWLELSLRGALPPTQVDKQGLTVLHVAAQHGRLQCLKLLLESQHLDVNVSCPRGQRPIHLAINSQNGDRANACLAYLLAQGAQLNVRTVDGVTPLHQAASEGLLDCTVTLVKAGGDLGVRDSRGHTPLDITKLWGHRAIARVLKDAMWKRGKQEQAEQHRELQQLKLRLLGRHGELQQEAQKHREHLTQLKFEEWAQEKALPIQARTSSNLLRTKQASGQDKMGGREEAQEGRSMSRPRKTREMIRHENYKEMGGSATAKCVQSPGSRKAGKVSEAWNSSTHPTRPPVVGIDRSPVVRLGTHPEHDPRVLDLSGCVVLAQGQDGQPYIVPVLGDEPLPAPSLPADVLHRSLFPGAHRGRLASPGCFNPAHLLDLPKKCPPSADRGTWSEVAMHLSETPLPGD
ncbi:ankyrin repeat domain 53 [Amia ocellicauda]|uniref:ankyrin repeat domain 53 n=1 Tax=Amia ocellicauda TaxID=2972642 RepID=UPI003464CAD9